MAGAGTVAEAGAWAEWVCSELDDLVVAGASSLESCEVSVDLMEAIGASGLLGRGQVAQSLVERALGLLVGAASAWHEALQAVLSVDSRGAEAAGGTGPEGEAADGAAGGGAGEAGAAEVQGPGDGPGAEAASAGGSQAGVVPVRPTGRWDRVKDRVPFQHAAVHGQLRGWGFTERSWKKASTGGCELGLVPAAGHVPHSDPVNDVFWVEAVDDHGNTVEGHPLFSTRDRLGGQEQYTEPSRRQALQELIEDKGLPKAISAGARTAALTGMGTVGGFLALQGSQTAAATDTGTAAVAGGAGLGAAWATHKAIAQRRGEIRDPTTPRTVRFTHSLNDLNNLRVQVRRGDHPRQAREAARADTLTLLEHRAREHGISGAQLQRARGRIKDLPGFPRNNNETFDPRDCQRAVSMHIPEGRERLVHDFLGLDDRNRKG